MLDFILLFIIDHWSFDTGGSLRCLFLKVIPIAIVAVLSLTVKPLNSD